VNDVVAAASAAGIDERYVERAFAERRSPAGESEPAPAPARGAPVAQLSWLSRFDALFRTEVEGELPNRDVERLINALRDQTGSLGTTFAHTRELAWMNQSFSSVLEVSVVPTPERTTIAIANRMRWRMRAALFLAGIAAGFVAGMTLGVILVEGFGAGDGGVFVALAAGATTAFVAGRGLFRSFRARAAQRVNALGDVIATKVRASIG
jgi:hypothetical protein